MTTGKSCVYSNALRIGSGPCFKYTDLVYRILGGPFLDEIDDLPATCYGVTDQNSDFTIIYAINY